MCRVVLCVVSASDFPASDFVRRRVQLFQKSFVSTVTRLLSSLALAVSAVTHESRYVRVTLADFLQMTTKTESEDRVTHLSSDFLDQCAAGQTDFVPCVPDALFPGITHARNDKVDVYDVGRHRGRSELVQTADDRVEVL